MPNLLPFAEMRMTRFISLLLTLMCMPMAVLAADDTAPAAITKTLKELVPDLKAESIKPTAVANLFEVVLNGQVMYMTGDGVHMLQGSLIDIKNKINLTEERRTELDAQRTELRRPVLMAALMKLSEADMVIFTPKKPVTHTVTVLTDIDCTYCRKMHNEIDKYLNKGIRVRYLLYPRSGLEGPSAEKAESVWCAKDRNAALTKAKSGEDPEKKQCDNPLQRITDFARATDISGTPALITDSGRMLPGYVPADQLAEFLEKDAAALGKKSDKAEETKKVVN